jgi:VCBS repeat-containing protein
MALRTVTYQNTSDAPSASPRTIGFEARSGAVASDSATRQVSVTATNDPPTAVNDSYTVVATQTLTVPAASGVLKNDTDVDSSAASLTAAIVATPTHGSVNLAANGGFTYTPASGFAGTDSFTYRASDGSAQSNLGTVTVVVTPTACVPRPRVQTAPVAGGGKLAVHVEATPLNTQGNNPLQVIRFGTLQNAKVTVNGITIGSNGNNQEYRPPANTTAVDFTVERVTPGQATTVPFTVVDGCGQWQTFVGGGPSAKF